MANELARFMETLWGSLEPMQSVGWHPRADICRTRTGWLIKFELAGVRPEDVQLTIAGRRLTARGVRRDTQIEDGVSYYSMEIAYCYFERSIELPCEVETARLETEYRDGILLVRLWC